jgi:hypothetical protein
MPSVKYMVDSLQLCLQLHTSAMHAEFEQRVMKHPAKADLMRARMWVLASLHAGENRQRALDYLRREVDKHQQYVPHVARKCQSADPAAPVGPRKM